MKCPKCKHDLKEHYYQIKHDEYHCPVKNCYCVISRKEAKDLLEEEKLMKKCKCCNNKCYGTLCKSCYLKLRRKGIC